MYTESASGPYAHSPPTTRRLPGDRAVGEWVVRAPKGTRLQLVASADRAGTVRTEVTLD